MSDTNDDDYSWTDLGFDFSDADPAGYYDSDGNYLGDDEAAAEEAGVDTSDWAEYDPDFGDVIIQTDGNGNITSTSYKDPETGGWVDSGLTGYQVNPYDGRTAQGQAGEAVQIFGTNLSPETLAALNGFTNKTDLSTMLGNAAQGNPAALAMATAITGTRPDPDSMRGVGGLTDEQINTAVTFAEELSKALAEGKSKNAAWKEASTKTGDPYGTNARDQMLKDVAINAIMTYGTLGFGTAAGLATGARTFKTSSTAVQGVRGVLNALGIGGRYAGKAGAATVNTAARLLNDLDKGASALSVVSGLINAGMSAKDAKALVDYHMNGKKAPESDSDDTRANADKTPVSTPATTTKPEPEAARPAATTKPEPEAAKPETKPDVVFPTNILDPGKPDLSFPKGPLDEMPLDGTRGDKFNPPTKEEAEDRGFETDDSGSDTNDDSGSDTMEETSQDAPTSGLGGDTFSNPNDDAGKHGWGLGEEDPNRSNYDVDKWNRGMERVSTDVVSDEKCKNFIKKTFKNDPVLVKTVRIMKSL